MNTEKYHKISVEVIEQDVVVDTYNPFTWKG